MYDTFGQDVSCGSEGLVVMDDASIIVDGTATTNDTREVVSAACKIHAKGTVAWKWQV